MNEGGIDSRSYMMYEMYMAEIVVSTLEFRAKLSDYLSRVTWHGDVVIVTRNGRPIVEVRRIDGEDGQERRAEGAEVQPLKEGST